MGGPNAQADEGAQPSRRLLHSGCVPALYRPMTQLVANVTRSGGFLYPALWEYQARHNGELPDDIAHVAELETLSTALLAKAEVNKQAITTVSHELLECVSLVLRTLRHKTRATLRRRFLGFTYLHYLSQGVRHYRCARALPRVCCAGWHAGARHSQGACGARATYRELLHFRW